MLLHGKATKYKASDDVRLNLHDLYLNGSLEFSTQERYIELWGMYTEGKEVGGDRASKLGALQDWPAWAAAQGSLSEADKVLCQGPRSMMVSYNRATIAGTRFRSSDLRPWTTLAGTRASRSPLWPAT